jgi:hypothetical protein
MQNSDIFLSSNLGELQSHRIWLSTSLIRLTSSYILESSCEACKHFVLRSHHRHRCFSYDIRSTALTEVIFLPLPTVRKLRVSLKKKLSIAFLFALGFVAIVFSIVRTILFLNDATLFKVIVWSTVETVVCFLVANGPGLRPLFFRGADFETSSSSNVIPQKRSSMPQYDMNPQEKGVVTVVTANLERTNNPMGGLQNCCADTVSILRTVEVTVESEDSRSSCDIMEALSERSDGSKV